MASAISASGRPQRNASRTLQSVYRDDWTGNGENEDDGNRDDDEEEEEGEGEEEDDDDDDDDDDDRGDGNNSDAVNTRRPIGQTEADAALDHSRQGSSSSRLPNPHLPVAPLTGASSNDVRRKHKSSKGKSSRPLLRGHMPSDPPPHGQSGMMAEAPDVPTLHMAIGFIMNKLAMHQWKGRRLIDVIEVVPDDPAFRARAQHFLSYAHVLQRSREEVYNTAESFDRDMMEVFTCFRRGYEIGSRQHGDTMILQRLYQCLTAPHPQVKQTTLASLQANFAKPEAAHHYASVSHGPAPTYKGVDEYLPTRIAVKGKRYYPWAYLKGHLLTVGDWVHLMNAADPSRPTVAQIWKIFKREGSEDEPAMLSVCWFFRPEQTIHPPSRTFFPNEVMKTGIYIDHALEDVMNKCHTLFYTRWTKGRPYRNVFDPLDPLYIVEYRFDERTHESSKIKNWNSCLPEEMRKNEPPLNLYPEPIPLPTRVPSPFLKGIQGPGRLCGEGEYMGGAGAKKNVSGFIGTKNDELPDPFGSPSKNKRPRYEPDQSLDPEASLVSGWISSHMPVPTPQQVDAANHIVQTYERDLQSRIGHDEFRRLYWLLSGPQGLTTDLNAVTHQLRGDIDLHTLTTWREALQINTAVRNHGNNISHKGQPSSSTLPAPTPATVPPVSGPNPSMAEAAVERSLAAAVGGLEAYVAPLSEEAAKLFASDLPLEDEEQDGETPMGETLKSVQWFAAPPLDLPRSVNGTGYNGLTHSLDYFYHLACKAGEPILTDHAQSRTVAQQNDEEGRAAFEHLAQSWKTLVETMPQYAHGESSAASAAEAKLVELENEVSKLSGEDTSADETELRLRKDIIKMVAGLS